ncbi:MAG: hypothetical protein Q4B10_06360 [Actinomycetaceae bacterium]|nr:hypothetical protein [Actinomycetaceae bacterium]
MSRSGDPLIHSTKVRSLARGVWRGLAALPRPRAFGAAVGRAATQELEDLIEAVLDARQEVDGVDTRIVRRLGATPRITCRIRVAEATVSPASAPCGSPEADGVTAGDLLDELTRQVWVACGQGDYALDVSLVTGSPRERGTVYTLADLGLDVPLTPNKATERYGSS